MYKIHRKSKNNKHPLSKKLKKKK